MYYLLLNKHIKRGNSSISDLFSREYIEYFNNPKSLLKNKQLEEKTIDQDNEVKNREKKCIINETSCEKSSKSYEKIINL